MTDVYSTGIEATPPDDEAEAAEAARQSAAKRLGRGVVPATFPGTEPDFSVVRNRATARGIQRITESQYKGLLPGEQFIMDVDPDQMVRTKPYEPKVPTDWKHIPEGAPWLDPEGNVQTKPVMDDAGPTANMLYHMSLTPAEKRKALRYSYPEGQIKEDPAGDLYIEQNGRFIKPRGISRAPVSTLVAGAAPLAGTVAGEVIGGVFGGGVGAIPGGAGGAVVGQGVNDLILAGLGIYDRSVWEQVANSGLAGIFGGVGSALGRLYALSVGSAVAAGKMSTTEGAAFVANAALGTDAEGLAMGKQLLQKGVEALPPSRMFPGSPQLTNIIEVYDRVFRGFSRIEKAAEGHMEKSAREILTGPDLGIDPSKLPKSIVHPEEAVATQEVGNEIIVAARAKVQRAYDELSAVQAGERSVMEGRIAAEQVDAPARENALKQAQANYQQAATDWLNAEYAFQNQLSNEAVAMSKAGRDSGDLWKQIATRFRALRQAFGDQAEELYGNWRQTYGQDLVSVTGLVGEAESLVGMLPPELRNMFPGAARLLAKMSGIRDPKTGEYVVEPVTDMTLAELHELRNWLRHKVDWRNLRSDEANGLAKHLAGEVDDTVRGVGSPRARSRATRELDDIDAWYRENGAIYEDARIQSVITGLKGGEPADPKILLHGLIREGRSDLNTRIRAMVGENLWSGVRAADIDDIFQAARTTVRGEPSTRTVDGGKYIAEVLERHRSGLLDQIHGKEIADRFLRQVESLKLMNPTAKMDVDIRPSDGLISAVTKIRETAEALKAEARSNPLGLLQKEAAKMRKEQALAMKDLQEQQEGGLLGFLFNPRVGADEAVNKILGSPDTVFAAERFFGRDSTEFKMLQQTYAQRMLQDTLNITKALRDVPKEVQEILFPNHTFDQMRMLAKEMDFLMGTRATQETAKSMAAQARVGRPESSPELGFLTKNLPRIPVMGPVFRMMLGKYYGMFAKLPQQMWLLNFLEKGLKNSDPAIVAAVREEFRREVSKAANMAGPVGAAVSESQYQAPNTDE